MKKARNNEIPELQDVFQSHHLAEKTTDQPLIRVMALHALAYYERLFYLGLVGDAAEILTFALIRNEQ